MKNRNHTVEISVDEERKLVLKPCSPGGKDAWELVGYIQAELQNSFSVDNFISYLNDIVSGKRNLFELSGNSYFTTIRSDEIKIESIYNDGVVFKFSVDEMMNVALDLKDCLLRRDAP